MNLRTVASLGAATAAGVLLTYVPLPSAAQVQAGLERFGHDAAAGLRAAAFDGGAWIEGTRAGLDTTLASLDLAEIASAPNVSWVAGAIVLMTALTLVLTLVLRRRRSTAGTVPHTAAPAATARSPRPRARAGLDRSWDLGTHAGVRLERARALAAAGRLGADVARESTLSRDAVELLLRLGPRPDGIAGTGGAPGRSFRGRRGIRARAAFWPFATR